MQFTFLGSLQNFATFIGTHYIQWPLWLFVSFLVHLAIVDITTSDSPMKPKKNSIVKVYFETIITSGTLILTKIFLCLFVSCILLNIAAN